MHFYGRSSEVALAAPPLYANHSRGYTQASLVDRTTGSVHTGLSLNVLAPTGTIAPHLHSYEEGFYILEGHAVLSAGDRISHLGPGDFGAFKVGTLHAWSNAGQGPVRWLQMAAPQPKPEGAERDTFFPRQETDRVQRRASAGPFRRRSNSRAGSRARCTCREPKACS